MAERTLLVLWLTGRCNLQCCYCYASANPVKADMTFETAKTMVDRLRDRPLKIQFAGGEPLLNFPLAAEICAYVRDQGLDAVLQMQTNGTLLDADMVRQLVRYRVAVGVSLDGVPAVNDQTRGQTAQALRGIRLLGEQGMTVGLNAVVTAETVDALPQLVDFAFYLGNVGGIGLDLLRAAGRGETAAFASPAQLRQALIRMARRSQELFALSGRRIQLRELELARKRLAGAGRADSYCYAACGRSIVVLPDGRLYPCGSLLWEDYEMGHADGFEPDRVLRLTPKAEDCGECAYAFCCPKGCPSRRIRNGGGLDCALWKTAFTLAEERNRNGG